MKVGLAKCPTVQDLENAYDEILKVRQKVKRKEGPIDLPQHFSEYCQWSRFDARLGEICVAFLSDYWKRIHPVDLHEQFAKEPWPSVLGVLLEFCTERNSKLFRLWKDTATCDFQKADWEQYFIGKRRIASQQMFDDARFSREEFKNWGFLAREVLRPKSGDAEFGLYSPATRLQILKSLLETSPRITVTQYWEAIHKAVSKRQAERDLIQSGLLRSIGATKGRFYISKRKTTAA